SRIRTFAAAASGRTRQQRSPDLRQVETAGARPPSARACAKKGARRRQQAVAPVARPRRAQGLTPPAPIKAKLSRASATITPPLPLWERARGEGAHQPSARPFSLNPARRSLPSPASGRGQGVRVARQISAIPF